MCGNMDVAPGMVAMVEDVSHVFCCAVVAAKSKATTTTKKTMLWGGQNIYVPQMSGKKE